MSGRRAALPDAGYEPPRRLFLDDATCRVRFISPNGASARDFDFTGLPVSAALQTAFAVAFDKHVGPSGTVHTADGAGNVFRCLRRFCELLAGLAAPPTDPAGLRPRHLDEHALGAGPVNRTVWGEDGILRRLLGRIDGVTPEFAGRCARPLPAPARASATTSYTRSEDERIQQAASSVVRLAARRSAPTASCWGAGGPARTSWPPTPAPTGCAGFSTRWSERGRCRAGRAGRCRPGPVGTAT